MHGKFLARGLILSALVLFVFSGCTPPPPPDSPDSRSLDGAMSALAAGDLPALRNALGQDAGFLDAAAEGAERFDPEGWLVWMGAARREYRLADASRALEDGDGRALLDTLGFGEQQLRADILNAGASIDARRARGRQYYETVPQPLDMLGNADLPRLPDGAAALHAMLIGRRGGRAARVEIGLRVDGVVDLRARREIAMTQAPRPADARELSTLSAGPWGVLHDAVPSDPRWYAVQVHCLLEDGRLLYLQLVRDEGVWFVARHDETSLNERLAAARDEALERVLARVRAFQRDRDRRPASPHELDPSGASFVDPAAPSGRMGWAAYTDDPPRGIEISDNPEDRGWVVRTIHRTRRGFRAITSDGRHIWVE